MSLKCKDCRWWKPDPVGNGECRRYAPQSRPDALVPERNYTFWPVTEAEDWCGDGQVKVEKADAR